MRVRGRAAGAGAEPAAPADDRLRALDGALHAWREHIPGGERLAAPLDPARDHWAGDPGAQLTVVEYGCYASAAGSGEDRELREALSEWLAQRRLCFAFRYFPVPDGEEGPWRGARAAEAAARQQRFWEMHQALTGPQARFDAHSIEHAAGKLGLDLERFGRDMRDERTTARILDDFESALRSGANGAPTYYICGRRQDVEGPHELRERLRRMLDGEGEAVPGEGPESRAPGGAEIPRAWYRALAHHELSSTLECFAEDVTWIGWNEQLPGGGRACGREALASLYANSPRPARFFARPRTLMNLGERVAVIGELSGRAAADTEHFTVPYVQIWELAGGVVTRVETFTDGSAAARLV
jgi:ketosteroid isomerase-like protein